MGIDAGRAFQIGWRVLPRLPEGLVRVAFDAAFRVAAARGGAGVTQLARNLARVRPAATDAELRRLTPRPRR